MDHLGQASKFTAGNEQYKLNGTVGVSPASLFRGQRFVDLLDNIAKSEHLEESLCIFRVEPRRSHALCRLEVPSHHMSV